MKLCLFIFCLLISITGFAMSCPDTGSVIEQGDALDDVIKQCGPPKTQNSYTEVLPQQWIYDDYRATNVQLTFSFENDRLTNIHILKGGSYCHNYGRDSGVESSCLNNDIDISATRLCGPLLELGISSADVSSACGNPSRQSARHAIDVTELTYNSSFLNTLIFEDKKLVTSR